MYFISKTNACSFLCALAKNPCCQKPRMPLSLFTHDSPALYEKITFINPISDLLGHKNKVVRIRIRNVKISQREQNTI